MERVRAALGENWPQRWSARVGRLPHFVSDPASNAIAYAQLIETGLRLESLAGTLRRRKLTSTSGCSLRWPRWLIPSGFRRVRDTNCGGRDHAPGRRYGHS